MAFSPSDRSTIETSFARAGERLRDVDALLARAAPDVAALRVAVLSAQGALAEAHAVVADPDEAIRVPCPYCGYRVMPKATLCLSCWHVLDPSRPRATAAETGA